MNPVYNTSRQNEEWYTFSTPKESSERYRREETQQTGWYTTHERCCRKRCQQSTQEFQRHRHQQLQNTPNHNKVDLDNFDEDEEEENGDEEENDDDEELDLEAYLDAINEEEERKQQQQEVSGKKQNNNNNNNNNNDDEEEDLLDLDYYLAADNQETAPVPQRTGKHKKNNKSTTTGTKLPNLSASKAENKYGEVDANVLDLL